MGNGILGVFFLIFLFFPVGGLAQSDSYEKNIHDIYTQYYSQKISQAQWESITSNVSGDIYTIKPSDTLWDISKVLFGDPFYWPKLWSINANISNPHLIYSGSNLGIIHGSQDSAPSFNIITQKGVGLTQSKQAHPITNRVDFLHQIKIKVAPKNSPPVLQNIPGSLPNLKLSREGAKKVSLADMDIGFANNNERPISPLSHFMSDDYVDSLKKGIVLSKKNGSGKWSQAEEVVILQMDNSVNPGQKLVVAEDLGKLSFFRRGIRGPYGYQVEIQGEVQVLGRVPESFDLYEARVTQSISPIRNKALVISGPLPQYNFKKTDTSGSGEAQIIGFPPQASQKIFGTLYQLAYLNRGSKSGFSVGQMYQARANLKTRRFSRYGYDIKLGELKIIHTENRFATAIITQMSSPIQLGDYVVPINLGLIQDKDYDPLADDDLDSDIEEEPEPEQKQPSNKLPAEEEDIEEIEDEEDDLDKVFEQSSESSADLPSKDKTKKSESESESESEEEILIDDEEDMLE